MVGIAQLVRVPGCGPGGRGFNSHYSPQIYLTPLGCRQAVRHGILIPASRRFDPFHPSQTFFKNYGPLAQSVEHLTFNQVVPRSIRGWITISNLICDRGGIGRRARLRIWYLRCGSSSLFGRTTTALDEFRADFLCGSGSVVERCLAKANVASSNLVFRSR